MTVDHDDLVNGGGGTDTRSGAPVSAADISKLCCDAGIARIVTKGESVPLDKGRAVLLATTEQRQALAAHFATCIPPGCSVPFWWTQIHHIDEFAADLGETNLADLAPVCNVDHDLLHHGGHRIERGDEPGELMWVTADGARYPIRPQPPNPPRPSHDQPPRSPGQLGLAV